jgi:lipoprotein-anchoring transpeptidase ErfK/SrfK
MDRRSGTAAVAIVVFVAVLTACSPTTEAPRATDNTITAAPTASTLGPDQTVPTSLHPRREPPTVVAVARNNRVGVYQSATAPTPRQMLDAVEDRPLVFVVTIRGTERLEVLLPIRPNGSTGWVDRADVDLFDNNFRVEVDLGTKRLRVHDTGEVVFETTIGVGRDATPTPGGRFYLKELLRPPDPDSIYGAYAYGLSGFSNTLESFAGGDGVIGIHGTNDPASIGGTVSAGCIRVTNNDITHLVETLRLPLGTPVTITN